MLANDAGDRVTPAFISYNDGELVSCSLELLTTSQNYIGQICVEVLIKSRYRSIVCRCNFKSHPIQCNNVHKTTSWA